MSIPNKGDLRSKKTGKALDDAMYSLLKSQKFGKITVSDICEEALISRATFYSHFSDKYALLKYWLAQLWPDGFGYGSTYEDIELVINTFILKYGTVMKNIISDANSETLDILFMFILSTLRMHPDMPDDKDKNAKSIVFSNISAGGLIYYLSWLARNNFPPEVSPMNPYLFSIIKELCDWEKKQ